MSKNASKLMFFASCNNPDCRKKLAIEPKYILAYAKRVFAAYKDKADSMSAMLELAQQDIEASRKRR